MNSEAVLPLEEAGSVLRKTLDIKRRLRRNPYGVVAGAWGMGFVLGGGLFTRLSARVLGTGLRVALMVALPIFEKQIMNAFSGTNSNNNRENDQ